MKRHTALARTIAFPLLMGTVGCGGPSSDGSPLSSEGGSPIEQTKQCIVGGSASSDYLRLEASQQSAIVQVHVTGGDASSQFSSTCSGVLVAEQWVLTAAHCTLDPDTTVAVVQFGADRAPGGAAQCRAGQVLTPGIVSRRVIAHPSLDLLLIELEEAPAKSFEVTSISIREQPPKVGAWMELAGFGWTEQDSPGHLRFAVEAVSELTTEHVVVEGDGRSGACGSDSGGPLLMRDERGVVRVVGILEQGSTSCVGIDRYVRLDLAAEWLTSLLPERSEPEVTCTALGNEGRCFDGVATWCQDGSLQASRCQGDDVCSFDEEAQGYRCGSAEASPCGAVDDLGTCDQGHVSWCEAGALTERSCGECYRSPISGKFVCEN